MAGIQLSEIQDKIDDMPALSPSTLELINVIDDVKTKRTDIAKLVVLDQTLCAKIFKYANSVAMAGVRSVQTANEAIDLLGLGELKNLAFMTAAKDMYIDPKNKKGDALWYSSVFLASGAHKFATDLNLPSRYCEELYMAGLMLSYGKILLNTYYADIYDNIKNEPDFYKLLDLEKARFGLNHVEISYMALGECGLPANVLEIIQCQQFKDGAKYMRQNAILELLMYLRHMDLEDEFAMEKIMRNREIIDLIQEYNLGGLKLNLKKALDLHKKAQTLSEL